MNENTHEKNPVGSGKYHALDVVRLHGRLYHAYQNCVGYRTLKAAFVPPALHWYNYLLWITTVVPPIILFTLLYLDWRFAWLNPFIQGVVMYVCVRPIVNKCLKMGLPEDYSSVGITGTGTAQPSYLHSSLLRLKWFQDKIFATEKPSKTQIESCISFIELIEKDLPPTGVAYFRHPIALLLLGIVVYLVNAKVGSMITLAIMSFERLSILVGISVAWTFGMGWLVFSLKHARAETRWIFLRYLRWTALSMGMEDESKPLGQDRLKVWKKWPFS